MSYILDALKKAEQERLSGRRPSATPVSRPRVFSQQPRWAWVMAAALVVNAAVLMAVLRPDRFGAPAPSSVAPGPSAAHEPLMAPPARGTARDARPDAPATVKPAERAATPAVAVVPEGPKPARPAPHPAKSGTAAVSVAPVPRPVPAQDPVAVTNPAPRTSPPPAATAAPGASSAPAASLAPAPTAGSATTTLPAPTAAPAPSRPPAAGAVPPPSAAALSATPAAPAPAPTAERREPAPRVVVRVPPREPAPPQRMPTEMPQVIRDAVPRLRLDALVYSDAAPQRMVFINNERYVEGQKIDDKVLVESITEQGAVLSYQGQRFLLLVERARRSVPGGDLSAPSESDR